MIGSGMATTRTEAGNPLEELRVGGAVLPLDKPSGPTSHDVVARARKALGLRRVGHSGTLDPFATGLLLLCIGPATRISEYLQGLPKTYLATAVLGVSTDSLDLDGSVTERRPVPDALDREAVSAALGSFVGGYAQVPPQFSAKKVGGEAMHRKARRGESVPLPPVPVTIHEAELVSFDSPTVTFRITCSAGTYVRSLARDLGDRLGTGAHLVALRRERIGVLTVSHALPADRLGDPDAVVDHAMAPLEALAHLPRVEMTPAEGRRIQNGQAVPVAALEAGEGDDLSEGLVVLSLAGRLLAMAELVEGSIRPRKVFPQDLPVGHASESGHP
jgi:tRNA pseudouridine55 synthase